MDPSSQRVLVGVLRILYASLGFLLSVFAALLSVVPRSWLQSPPPTIRRPRLPPAAKGRKPPRVFSDQSPIRPPRIPSPSPTRIAGTPVTVVTPDSPNSPPPSNSSAIPNKRLGPHRRARSIPTITVDFFGSTDQLRAPAIRFALPDSAPSTPIALSPIHSEPEAMTEPEPLLLSEPASSSASVPSPPSSQVSPKPASLLTQFKQSLTKDKSPRMQRVRSSPHMAFLASDPAATSPIPPLPCPFNAAKDKDKHRTVRKVPSTPSVREGWGLNKSKPPAEKKRSSMLRTDPYEAPYFCPPPTVNQRPSPTSSPKSIPRKLSKPRIFVPL